MSDALGLSVPHLNRTLGQLRAEGIIAVNERRVEFVDPEAIGRLAQFQPIKPARIPGSQRQLKRAGARGCFGITGWAIVRVVAEARTSGRRIRSAQGIFPARGLK